MGYNKGPGGIAKFDGIAIKAGGPVIFPVDAVFSYGGVTMDKVTKVVKIPLATATADGGMLHWQNPEATAIIVTRAFVNLVTVCSVSGATVDFGVGAFPTTHASDLMTALDVNAATGTFDNITNKGASGKATKLVPVGGYVTGSSGANGLLTAMKGDAFLQYVTV